MLMLTRLAPLMASFASVDVGLFINRLRRNLVIYALVLLFSLTAYFALVAAGAVVLAEELGAAGALLAVAGGAVFLALVLLLAARLGARAEEKRRRETAASSGSKALLATAAVSFLPIVLKSRPLAVLAVAGGLGFLAMRNMDGIAAVLQQRPRQGPPPGPGMDTRL
ncbi:MAG: hypothetical protein ACK4N1_11720 [Pseudorhizobium sp.]